MADVCKFRVQYVDDLDPFNVVASIKHAEPTVARKFEFLRNVPLCDQLAAVKKLLRAPHKVCSPRGGGSHTHTLECYSGPRS